MVEPDGTVRTVKYTADKENGFQAQVITNGKVVEHGNTGSDESSYGSSSEGFTNEYYGSHSMEHGSVMHGGSNSLSSGRTSSEEGGYDRSAEGDEDDDGDDDAEDDEDED